MNKEAILALEVGRELETLVAEKVMGIEVAKKRRRHQWVHIPEYSREIGEAWKIVEKLQPTFWVRMNSMMDEHYCGVGSPDMLWEYKSKSMPECICKAALLAVMDS